MSDTSMPFDAVADQSASAEGSTPHYRVGICRDDRIGKWIAVCKRPNILLLTGSTVEEVESGVDEALKAALDSLPDEELWAEESKMIGADKVIVDIDVYLAPEDVASS